MSQKLSVVVGRSDSDRVLVGSKLPFPLISYMSSVTAEIVSHVQFPQLFPQSTHIGIPVNVFRDLIFGDGMSLIMILRVNYEFVKQDSTMNGRSTGMST